MATTTTMKKTLTGPHAHTTTQKKTCRYTDSTTHSTSYKQTDHSMTLKKIPPQLWTSQPGGPLATKERPHKETGPEACHDGSKKRQTANKAKIHQTEK